MKTIVLFCSLIALSFAFHLQAQEITFDEKQILFPHPVSSGNAFNSMYIPMDYNNDNLIDFIGKGSSQEQLIYKGMPNDTFEIINIFQGLANLPFAAMDFDMDGDTDIIMERYINIYESEDSFTVLNPNFDIRETIVGVADFNGDGFNDLLTLKTVSFENSQIILNTNNGDNTFTPSIIYNNYREHGAIDIGDIDSDGDLDIIALIFGFGSGDDDAVIFKNQGNNTFLPAIIDFSFLNPNSVSLQESAVSLTDINNNGKLDLVMHSFNNILIFENTDGFESAPTNYTVIESTRLEYFQVADFNNDGLAGIALVSKTTGAIQLL